MSVLCFFFFIVSPPTGTYTVFHPLYLHDALPIVEDALYKFRNENNDNVSLAHAVSGARLRCRNWRRGHGGCDQGASSAHSSGSGEGRRADGHYGIARAKRQIRRQRDDARVDPVQRRAPRPRPAGPPPPYGAWLGP